MRIFLLFASLIFCLYWAHIRMTPDDIIACTKILEEREQLREKHVLDDHPAFQAKTKVKKEIYSQSGELLLQILSASSEVRVEKRGSNCSITEHLSQVESYGQDQFQLIADEGDYLYPSQNLHVYGNCRMHQKEHYLTATEMHFDLAKEVLEAKDPIGFVESFDFLPQSLTS